VQIVLTEHYNLKEFSISFYPKVIFIEGVVKYGKIPTEILL
jgi:hypothetical protein